MKVMDITFLNFISCYMVVYIYYCSFNPGIVWRPKRDDNVCLMLSWYWPINTCSSVTNGKRHSMVWMRVLVDLLGSSFRGLCVDMTRGIEHSVTI